MMKNTNKGTKNMTKATEADISKVLEGMAQEAKNSIKFPHPTERRRQEEAAEINRVYGQEDGVLGRPCRYPNVPAYLKAYQAARK